MNPDDSDLPPAQKYTTAGTQQDESQMLEEVPRYRPVCTVFNAENQGPPNFSEPSRLNLAL